MTDVRRIDPGPRLSEASVCGDRMYLSGMIPEDTSLDITGQVNRRCPRSTRCWRAAAATRPGSCRR